MKAKPNGEKQRRHGSNWFRDGRAVPEKGLLQKPYPCKCPYSRALPPEAVHQIAVFFTASLAEVMLGGSLTVDLRKVNAVLSCMASTLKLCLEFGSSVGHPALLVSLSLHLSSSLAKPLLFVLLLCPKHHRHK